MKKIAIIYGSSTHNTDVKDVSADGYTFDDLKAFRNGEAANRFTEETERLFWQFGFV